mmetsp:Transcript_104983/g.338542  ORF Transcript_104983/g.338542 Transcript_104983/m.338542 type:complete len:217 (-) Transcript_104983:32-682(-)
MFGVFVALCHHLIGNLEERAVDVVPRLRRGLVECHVEIAREGLALLFRDLAEDLVCEVRLVAHEDALHSIGAVIVELLDPILNVVEAGPVGDIVGDDNAHCRPVVRRRDRTEALLPGGVPDLEPKLPAVALNRLPLEVHTDGQDKVGVKAAITEAHQERGLAYCGVAQQQQLHEMVVVGGGRSTHGSSAGDGKGYARAGSNDVGAGSLQKHEWPPP